MHRNQHGPDALAVGMKNAREHPNNPASAKIGHSPPRGIDRHAKAVEIKRLLT